MVYHGSQRPDRVSRLLREMNCELHWVNPTEGEALPEDIDNWQGAVVFGGVHSVNDDRADIHAEQSWIKRWVGAQKPYLGLCLGGQFLAKALGAPVRKLSDRSLEMGYVRIDPMEDNPWITRPMYVFEWHNEGFTLPENCTWLARGQRCPVQAFSHRPWIIGLQFHPEVVPHVAVEWYQEAGEQQHVYAAQNLERQLRDAETFEPYLEQWTTGLLQQWLEAGQQVTSENREIAHG